MAERWSVEQVQAVAPSPAAVTAARAVATPASWGGLGCGDEVLWGRCRGSGAEPYDTIVDHVHVAFGCSCPSRRRPCKHALALLLLWIAGHVPDGTPPTAVERWLERQARSRQVTSPPSPSGRDAADPRARPPADATESGNGSGGPKDAAGVDAGDPGGGPAATGDRAADAGGRDTPADGSAIGSRERGDGATAGSGEPDDGSAIGRNERGGGATAGSGEPGGGAAVGRNERGDGASPGWGEPGGGAAVGRNERGDGATAGSGEPGGAAIRRGAAGDGDDVPPPPGDDRDPDRDTARDERVARMAAGLAELDRWLDDRIRTGLADPAVARYGTWDSLAARLVDAQAGSLANRVRRLAGVVGASAQWHDDLLAELGMLHLLARAGRHLGDLPSALADSVATSVGWQVRRADVLAGVPDTDDWLVAARSDQREDRIEVRRHWLRGMRSGRWALVLSFAAYQQSLDDSLRVGQVLGADLHRYPGPALRALVGRRFDDPRRMQAADVGTPTLADACAQLGRLLVREPWLDRVPAIARASLCRRADRWVLGDERGSMPIHPDHQRSDGTATLLAVSGGAPLTLAFEWTPHGVIPTTLFPDDDRSEVHDIGPRADPSFVAAA